MNAAFLSKSELQTRPVKSLLLAASLVSLTSSVFAALPGDSAMASACTTPIAPDVTIAASTCARRDQFSHWVH